MTLVFENKTEGNESIGKIGELRISATVRCEHWREAFWKARRFGIDLEKIEQGIKWIGVYSLCPIDSATEDLQIISTIDLLTRRNPLDVMDSCISEHDLVSAAEEKRNKKDLNPDELDSKRAGF